jgi:hypothetical protein
VEVVVAGNLKLEKLAVLVGEEEPTVAVLATNLEDRHSNQDNQIQVLTNTDFQEETVLLVVRGVLAAVAALLQQDPLHQDIQIFTKLLAVREETVESQT